MAEKRAAKTGFVIEITLPSDIGRYLNPKIMAD
eukprot:CAMPEP_0114585676 /NCGR_PEP_ID=MMETSP0125-20121206/9145_1 /TAXON_ID=485358 ORGANISM="Aristerostoma sp., Strain ATCC 50986" /NCGR_SAMPLE_ID=MMETSP0125 /ASSEMBLY_ACC=CAM_ASM_000245 /LENGTH=32 /DNA_ID= /DNA_START= /DNA_END= /DNA_ORIENTATION=